MLALNTLCARSPSQIYLCESIMPQLFATNLITGYVLAISNYIDLVSLNTDILCLNYRWTDELQALAFILSILIEILRIFLFHCFPHSTQATGLTTVAWCLKNLPSPSSPSVILSDTMCVCTALREQFPIWIRNSFTSSDGKAYQYSGVLQHILSLTDSFSCPIHVQKVAAHTKTGIHAPHNNTVDTC